MTAARNSPERYSALSISLHWLMLALIVAAYAAINLRELFPKGSDPREALKALHYLLGLGVLLLALVRVVARMAAGPTPAIAPPLPRVLQWSARGMVLALYGFMLVMPVLGLATLGAEGKSVALLGWTLPSLVGPDKALAEALGETHEAIGTAGYFLIGLHAAAALFHHYVRHDNTLARMLPRLRLVLPD